MSVVPGEPRKQVVAYCADCKKPCGSPSLKDLDRWVTCPTDPSHYAAVVRGEAGKKWLIFERLIRNYELKWSPINKFGLKEKAGRYMFLRLILLILSLSLVGLWPWYSWLIFSLVAAICLFDIIVPNTSVAFCTQAPTRPFRTVVLTLFAFFQIGVAFAIVHRVWDPMLPSVEAIYKSIAIMTTLEGPSRETYQAQGWWGWLFQCFVMFQLLISLYFLSIVIAIIASWSNGSPARQESIPGKKM